MITLRQKHHTDNKLAHKAKNFNLPGGQHTLNLFSPNSIDSKYREQTFCHFVKK